VLTKNKFRKIKSVHHDVFVALQ